MTDIHAEIDNLMGSVLDLLTERRDDPEIMFSTLLCICVDIALANDLSRMEFMAFCMEMYRARSTPDGEVVH
jgi:hypothetical protein